MPNEITVDVGLLWDVPLIRGELVGNHAVEVVNENGRQEAFTASGAFHSRCTRGKHAQARGVRLAESLSPRHALKLCDLVASVRHDLDLEVIEAGRQWITAGELLDARVWWPVIRAEGREHLCALMNEMRDLPGLDPLGISAVTVSKAASLESFYFDYAHVSRRVREVHVRPLAENATFKLQNVPIGRGFHWQHHETLEYRGDLLFFHPGGAGLTAKNRLPIEIYLQSTVSSEMRRDLPPAFSQAQAIAARSTVLATANRHHFADGFDVCNDDHCQCYQGVLREADAVVEPVRETAGQVLTSDGRVVDARYAKSCGGVSELYENAWGGEEPNYFAVRACGEHGVPNLVAPREAKEFLLAPPKAWCNGDAHPYPVPWDQDPLFRWKKEYSRAELGEIVEQKTGRKLGAIQSLEVLRRGPSGRILILDVIGERGALRAYGELNIRRALSLSHLPSSYFVVEQVGDRITLIGGGWGHGVGLCQLGAVAMARSGWDTKNILAHYYPNSTLTSI